MSRFNPLLLQKPDAAEETITVSDPLQPGIEATFTLRARSDALWRQERIRRAAEYVQRYVTGDALYVKSKGAEGEPPAPLFAPGDNAAVPVSEGLCAVIASLAVMQEEASKANHGSLESIPRDSEDKPLTFLEWALVADRMGNAFEDLTEAASALLDRAEGRDREGNALAARTARSEPNGTSSSAPPSGTA